MTVLVTGANGFLGIHLCSILLEKGYDVIATGRGETFFPEIKDVTYEQMDFTDPFAVHDLFEKYKPQTVIHAGAMTRVDECEQQQWDAYVTNVEATITLLLNAESYKSLFLFVSTDFVFDGEKGYYKEDDETNPVNFYGKTKEQAEEAVKEYEYGWAIIRTSLVYGKAVGGKANILTVIKEKLDNHQSYGVVNDQVRTPTYVGDLAGGIVSIIEKKARGIFHISGKDVLTPYEMACQAAAFLNASPGLIQELDASGFTQPAKRPLKTNLVIDKAKKFLGYNPIPFEEGLRRTFE
jgi:dTDP-4-dehydrorhamnose reductase